MIAKTLAQLALEHLAGRTERDRFDEDDVVRNLPPRHFAGQMREQLFATHRVAAFAHDHKQRSLAPLRVRHRDAGDAGEGRMRQRDVLQLDRADPSPSFERVAALYRKAAGSASREGCTPLEHPRGHNKRHSREQSLVRIPAIFLAGTQLEDSA